jgi:biotin carboxyl carrier protein
MIKVKTNGGSDREIILSGNEFTVDGKQGTWDKIALGNNRFHVLKDNRSYRCEVLSTDRSKKTMEIRVNGNICRVEWKDRFDELLQKMGMEDKAGTKVNVIKAPMPGLVLKIIASEGMEIKQGDAVLILEAMKMENVIKSPGHGIVKAIRVKPKDPVEKGQVLVELA